MIEQRSAAQFLSGRFGALVLLLAYQALLARALPPGEYAAYALTLAWCSLLQTLFGLGLPRVFSRFLSRIGQGVSPRVGGTILTAAIGIRLTSGAISGAAALLMTAAVWPGATPYALAGAAWGVFGLLQFELDAAAQAMGLQRAARRAALGEPLLRLGATAALATVGGASAVSVLWIGAATAAIASIVLAAAAAFRLNSLHPYNGPSLDWRAVRRTALGGHAGALSWALSSPPVIRLLARTALSTEAFAGFSFAQALVVSLQRYMPSFVLFPLLEPAVMADAQASGVFGRLRSVLSLLVKLDAVAAGAGIAASAAGLALLPPLAHGRYGGAAVFMPWLLTLVVLSGAHRAYEVAALAIGASDALGRALLVSLGWMGLALVGTWRFGVPALLFWPLGEGVTRLWTVQRTLDRRGLSDLLDLRRLRRIGGAALTTAAAAWTGVRLLKPEAGVVGGALVGGAAALAFLALCIALKPIGQAEAHLLRAAVRRLVRRPMKGRPLRVVVLTPRGRRGVGGVDRLMDSLRPILAATPDLQTRLLATRGPWRWCSPAITVFALARFCVWLAWNGIDVAHMNLGVGSSFVRKRLFAAFCRRMHLPYVVHLHGSGFEAFWDKAPPARRAHIDRLFEDAALILVLGERWRDLVARRAPSAADRVLILPNASRAIERIREGAIEGDAPVSLLFLGEVGPRKGVAVLLDALARLPKTPSWRAVIAGEGDASPYIAAARTAGLADRIAFPGHLSPDKVESALATADILALPSFEENLPMSIIEAMGAGLAVVATPVGAVSDLIQDGQTGLLIPVGDTDALAKALGRLIQDGPLRRRLGAAAKARHAADLSLDAYAAKLVSVWRHAFGA